jgi:lipoyl-dependent peroxiredoxin
LGSFEEDMMNRKAYAIWRGTGKDGTGTLTSDSGILSATAYSFRTRFESEPGTNPEELIAAAHAGCFAMALAFGLQQAGYTPTELRSESTVTLQQEGTGFRIVRSALTLAADVPDIERERFAEIAEGAKEGCPVSKLLNAEITLDWTLQ